MPEIKITIFWNEANNGWQYDIFDSISDEAEPIDGGLCTGSLADALDMATSQTDTTEPEE